MQDLKKQDVRLQETKLRFRTSWELTAGWIWLEKKKMNKKRKKTIASFVQTFEPWLATLLYNPTA